MFYASIAHGVRSFLVAPMDSKCAKCYCAIGNAEYVYCGGFCVEICKYHTQCTGMTEKELDVCNNGNVFWMCERCRCLLENATFRSTINALDAVHFVQQKEHNRTVNELKDTIAQLTDSISGLVEKKPETSCENKTDDSPNPDIPLSSTQIVNSTEISSEQRNETFKLFLSNIDRGVTEADISVLVSARVGTQTPFSVKKLVPAWQPLENVDYISFKVELDARDRKKALSSGTWPSGMRYREFRDRNRDVPWSPRQYGILHRPSDITI